MYLNRHARAVTDEFIGVVYRWFGEDVYRGFGEDEAGLPQFCTKAATNPISPSSMCKGKGVGESDVARCYHQIFDVNLKSKREAPHLQTLM